MKKQMPSLLILGIAALVIGGLLGVCHWADALPARWWPTPTMAPTPTSILQAGPIIINAVRTHARLETVVMNIVGDYTVTRVSGIAGLCTERIVYLGYYDVTAGVDLAKIQESDITVASIGDPPQTVVTVTLPPAEILSVTLDTQHSRLLLQETPTWIPGCETQVADMTLEAQQKIQQYAEAAARERGILQLARERAGFELQRLLLNTGFPNVVIK